MKTVGGAADVELVSDCQWWEVPVWGKLGQWAPVLCFREGTVVDVETVRCWWVHLEFAASGRFQVGWGVVG